MNWYLRGNLWYFQTMSVPPRNLHERWFLIEIAIKLIELLCSKLRREGVSSKEDGRAYSVSETIKSSLKLYSDDFAC